MFILSVEQWLSHGEFNELIRSKMYKLAGYEYIDCSERIEIYVFQRLKMRVQHDLVTNEYKIL